MSTRRNALDNDLLADLGIGTTPAAADPASDERAPAGMTQTASQRPAVALGTSKTKRIGVDVSEEVWIATKIVAAQQGTTVAHLIRHHLAYLVSGEV